MAATTQEVPRPYGRGISSVVCFVVTMNRVDVVDLLVDLVDVNLDVDLVDVDLDVDLVDMLFVVMSMSFWNMFLKNRVFVIFARFANTNNPYLESAEIMSRLELLVLKNLIQRTSRRVNWTSGA